ncbi:hypothetical protein SprV_0200928700 [Sparganum proliferum]
MLMWPPGLTDLKALNDVMCHQPDNVYLFENTTPTAIPVSVDYTVASPPPPNTDKICHAKPPPPSTPSGQPHHHDFRQSPTDGMTPDVPSPLALPPPVMRIRFLRVILAIAHSPYASAW